ncbi:HEAT repeat domain-containing protein [Hazenella coriacea]|uniref:HEAT repeat protein n=1 Tax=Hazenella coriacea TaxID=1179467 RepID=A0A4R3L612_9BACL|nr:HEAT repeat domain-containing protein [Hazenella coriacea]TCS93624.1 HEAT repeat protein [Hazenella coriacea]
MLERLDQINWKCLAHAYGSAEDVPDLIWGLTSAKENVRHSAWSGLYSSILYEEGVCEAATLAVPFLIELIESESVPDRHRILIYLVDLANATCYLEESFEEDDWDEDFYPEGIQLNKEKDWVKETRSAVQKGLPIYTKLLHSPKPMIRSAAAYVLGNIGVQPTEAIRFLRVLLQTEQDPLVQASILLSLNHLKDNHPETISFMNASIQTGTSSLISIVATLALLRINSNHSKAIQLLVDTLNHPDKKLMDLYQQLPPYKHWLIRDIFLCFRDLPKHQTRPYIPDLIAIFQRSKEGYLSLAWILLSIVFNTQKTTLNKNDLTKEQIFVLQAIAEFDSLWKDGGCQEIKRFLEMKGLPYFYNQEELKNYLLKITFNEIQT